MSEREKLIAQLDRLQYVQRLIRAQDQEMIVKCAALVAKINLTEARAL